MGDTQQGLIRQQGRIRLGIIGLGAMGAEMLDVAQRHPEFEVVLAADPSERALDRVRSVHGDLALSRDPAEVLGRAGIDAVYVAAPPNTHARYAVEAMKAGRAVFCEKPLAVDPADGAEMVAVAEATGTVNALNFALSDRAAALEVARAVRAGEAGEVVGVELRLLFPQWPRPFQQEADWLAGREQGGFLREVASHFVFLTDRLLGPLEPVHTQVAYGPRSEIGAVGLLTAGTTPVRALRAGGGRARDL
ncbi:Gfo/Idh/MocA family protein [Streptacidiphilus sp. PAMC 29251]